jgi:hypothetical protein
MKKGSISLTVKAIFAVFLVIFVMFIAISSLSTRNSNLTVGTDYILREKINNFFMAFIANPACLTAGDNTNSSKQTPVLGLLDYAKIRNSHNQNKDMSCMENYDFLYSIQVTDLVSAKSWISGLNDTKPGWAAKTIKRTMPIAIMYDGTSINLGEISIYAYSGDPAGFYGTLKRICSSRKSQVYDISNQEKITYDPGINQFCIGAYCFTPYFSCEVNTFTIEPGHHKIYLQYNGGTLQVV